MMFTNLLGSWKQSQNGEGRKEGEKLKIWLILQELFLNSNNMEKRAFVPKQGRMKYRKVSDAGEVKKSK